MIRSQRSGINHQGGIGIDVFTPDERQAIHWGTVEVLETAGLWVEDDEAIDLFADGGCKVDRSTRKVRIPQHVLEECIGWAPSTVTLCGRTPDKDIVLEGRRVAFTNFAEGVKAVDPWDRKLRPTTKKDVADLARLVDALDDIEVYTIAVTATDVPPEVAEAHLIEQSLLNTTKPICSLALGHHGARLHIDAAAAVVGGDDKLADRPMLLFLSCPVSPLKLMGEFSGCIIEAARSHQVAMPLSMAMSGGSAPVTLAGTMVTHNAEVLGGIVLAQLAEKGAKCVYGTSTTAFDLQRAAATVGTPELGLISAAVAEMGRFYNLPTYGAGL
jgi:trimethylamine---corrinoid protein Co-methyltransferase